MHGAIAPVPQVSSFDLPGQMEISMADQRPRSSCAECRHAAVQRVARKQPKHFVPLIGNQATFQQVFDTLGRQCRGLSSGLQIMAFDNDMEPAGRHAGRLMSSVGRLHMTLA
jgi:hypothetical protein